MRILVFCPAGRSRTQDVYPVVLDAVLPLLRDLGETLAVGDARAEVPALHREAQSRGERCLLLCFAAPHEIPAGLSCPAVCVLLGPFDTVGDEARPGETAGDWRRVLEPQHAAIALSPAARAVVHSVMGDAFPVHLLSTPLFERFGAGFRERREAPLGRRSVAVEGDVFDSRDYDFEAEDARCRAPLERYCTRAWSGAREELAFGYEHASSRHLGGFYEPEQWGSWSRIRNPWVMLPFPLSGSVKLTLCAAGYGRNANRTIDVEIGAVRRELTLWPRFEETCLAFDLSEPTHRIQFRGLDTDEIKGAGDHRSMGIGLRWIALEGTGVQSAPALAPALRQALLDGVVYTSLDADFADADDRIKVWGELIKAFCFAFRHTQDAVLLLHATRLQPGSFAELQSLLHRIGTIAGRVVVLHGELDERQMDELIAASTYYLCAARYESLCLGLKRFRSRGVPALVPDHLARWELAGTDSALTMRYVAETPGWPVPEWSGARKATRHRADWERAVECFTASHRIARQDASTYAAMCRSSREAEARASAGVRAELERLLHELGSA